MRQYAFDDRTTKECLGERDLTNRKPYRTKSQKCEARGNSRVCKDGATRSTAPTSLHKAFNEKKHGD